MAHHRRSSSGTAGMVSRYTVSIPQSAQVTLKLTPAKVTKKHSSTSILATRSLVNWVRSMYSVATVRAATADSSIAPANYSHPMVEPFNIVGPDNEQYDGTFCLPQVRRPYLAFSHCG